MFSFNFQLVASIVNGPIYIFLSLDKMLFISVILFHVSDTLEHWRSYPASSSSAPTQIHSPFSSSPMEASGGIQATSDRIGRPNLSPSCSRSFPGSPTVVLPVLRPTHGLCSSQAQTQAYCVFGILQTGSQATKLQTRFQGLLQDRSHIG